MTTHLPAMTLLNTPRAALSLVLVAALAACGGGETRTETLQATPAPLAGAPSLAERMRALAAGGGSTAAAAVNISNAQFFQWATLQFAALFPANPVPLSLTAEGLTWDIRAYANGNYLAVASNGRAYGLGPVTGNTLVDLGVMQAFAGDVCSKVDCGGGGGSGGGTGALNECTMPASQALATGNRWLGTYTSTSFGTGGSSGEYSLDAKIDGPASFEGQSAVKMTTLLTGSQLGVAINNTSVTYSQAGSGGLIDLLGHELEYAIGGIVNKIKVVNTPPEPNSEFTLSQGSSFTKTVTSTTTTTFVGLPLPPQTNTGTTNRIYKFEARESISVAAGTFSTCRYRTTDSSGAYSLQWHIVGSGFAARFEQYSEAGALTGRNELKSGTFNGAPL